MKTLNVRDEFNCSADTFWEKYLLDDGFNERLNPHIGIKRREVLEKREQGDELYRKIKNHPAQEAPAILQKAIGSDMSYVEESWFNRKTKNYHYKVTSGAAGKKLDFTGVIKVTPLGENRCVRELTAQITVNIMLVGGTVEGLLGKQVEDGFKAAAKLIQQEIQAGK